MRETWGNHGAAKRAGLFALLLTALLVIPVRGQTPEPGIEVSAFRASVTRAGARLAVEGPGAFEMAQGGATRTEESSEWERLGSVTAGTKLVVSRPASPDLKARMQAVVADTLRVRTSDGRVLHLHRDELLAVYRDHSFTTAQWIGIGLLTGVGAGVVLGVVADSQCGDCELRGLGVAMGSLGGTAYGALGGLVASGIANRNPPRLIYRAPRPSVPTALPTVRRTDPGR